MKKQILALFTAMSALVGGLQASDCPGAYVGGFAGANFLQHDAKKVGFGGGVALGYEFENHIRLEGEFAYRRNKVLSESVDDVDVSVALNTYSTMANVLYDIDLGCRFTPYVGAGIGYAWNTVSVDASHKHGSVGFHAGNKGGFAYQGIAGVAYNLTEKTSIGLEYRYFQNNNSAFKNHNHTVAVSLRQSF